MGDALRNWFFEYAATLNAHRMEGVAPYYSDNVTVGDKVMTSSDIVASLTAQLKIVPDLQWRATEVLIDGNRIAARSIISGTPEQPFLGIAQTGRSFEVVQMSVYELLEGRFSSVVTVRDVAALARQLST